MIGSAIRSRSGRARRRHAIAAAVAALVITLAGGPGARAQMPDVSKMSGVPLPVNDLPVGTVAVRVVRGTLANNVAGAAVEFIVNGEAKRVTADGNGRAQIDGVERGARVKAVAVIDGERIESQDIVIAATGVRVVLAASDAAAGAAPPAARTVAPGTVVFGPETRVVAEMANERLNIFYAIQILNPAQTFVDTGGPVVIELPRSARGAHMLQGSSAQATANGPRVTVTGPFAPGTTTVDVGFELPHSSGTVRLEQRFPVTLQQILVLVPQRAGLDFTSPQTPTKRQVASEGVPVTVGLGPELAPGQPLVVDLTGLPFHARWPRYTALAVALAIMGLGIWAAVFTGPRQRAA